jgi:fatty acid desaturase
LAKPQSVTSLEASPEDERRSRMRKYTIAMSVRMVCIVLGVVLDGWLMWAAFAGAVFLPYFAVVLANSSSSGIAGSTKAVAPKLVLGPDRFRDAG